MKDCIHTRAPKSKGKDGKDLEVVIGNDGSYVPATKYEDLRNQLNHTEQTLKSVSSTLKELGGLGDPEKLSDDIKQVQSKMKTSKEKTRGLLCFLTCLNLIPRTCILECSVLGYRFS